MRRSVFHLAAAAGASAVLSGMLNTALAQTPTYAPSSPLVAPGDPQGTTIPQSTIPQPTLPSTIPQTTIPSTIEPQSTIPGGTYTIPGNGLQVPSGNSFDPPATIVTPGSVPPNRGYGRGWYPGYWMGIRPNDPPYGGGAIPYQSNYQSFGAPYGAPGGCNTCAPACGPQNLDFGRGYDGFMTGW